MNVKEARRQFEELRGIDTSVIDHGQFDSKLVALYTEMASLAKKARLKEGEYRSTGEQQHAFELWQPVFDKCVTLEEDFYNSSKVNWAKQRHRSSAWLTFGQGLGFTVIGSLVTLAIQELGVWQGMICIWKSLLSKLW